MKPAPKQFAGSRATREGISVTPSISQRSACSVETRVETQPEAKFFELSQDLFCIANLDGRILCVNPAWERLFGCIQTETETSGTEVKSLSLRSLLPLQNAGLADEYWDRLVRGEPTEKLTCRAQSRDGSCHWICWTAVLDSASQTIYAIGRDVTENIRMQAQILQSEKLATLGEMVAGVAHEINNPLAAISGSAQLLEMHPEEKVRLRGTTIRRMTDRATRIVRALLTFSRTEGEERWLMSLNTAVESALEICGYKLKFADIEVDLRLDPTLPETIANENQIQQIALNLITNAEHVLRGRTEGERRITIVTELGCGKEGLPFVALTVSDNGSGIPDDVLPHIFEPFFTTKDIGEGTGLGLSICHGIAAAHGGTLIAQSQAGTGATLTLTLPVVQPMLGILETPEQAAEMA